MSIYIAHCKQESGNLCAWAEPDYGLSAGQHAVLPEGKGKESGNPGFFSSME